MDTNYATLYASLQPALAQLETRRKELRQKGYVQDSYWQVSFLYWDAFFP